MRSCLSLESDESLESPSTFPCPATCPQPPRGSRSHWDSPGRRLRATFCGVICVTSRWVWPEPLLLRGTSFTTLLLLRGFSMAPVQPFVMRFCRRSHRDGTDLVLPNSCEVKGGQKRKRREKYQPCNCVDVLGSVANDKEPSVAFELAVPQK